MNYYYYIVLVPLKQEPIFNGTDTNRKQIKEMIL